MSERTQANRYAQAILEAVLEQWRSTLNQVSTALAQNPGLRSTLSSTTQDDDAKTKALQEVVPQGTPQEIQNFLSLLVQNGDLDLIPLVLAELGRTVTGQAEPIKAEIASAVELGEQEQADLRRRLVEQYGESLVFSFRVDPSLLGGLRVRVGDTLIDNTVASRLAAMREMVTASVR